MDVRLEHQVGIIAFGERLKPLVDGLLVALLQQAGVTMRRVPDHPGVGVVEVVGPMPGERIEVPPVAGQRLGGVFHVRPVDCLLGRHRHLSDLDSPLSSCGCWYTPLNRRCPERPCRCPAALVDRLRGPLDGLEVVADPGQFLGQGRSLLVCRRPRGLDDAVVVSAAVLTDTFVRASQYQPLMSLGFRGKGR